MLLCACRGGAWVLEQPRNSWMFHHPRIRWLITKLPATRHDMYYTHTPVLLILFHMCCEAKVWRVDFWMVHYKSRTPKRTSLISNSRAIGHFDKGALRNWRKTKQRRHTLRRHTRSTEVLRPVKILDYKMSILSCRLISPLQDSCKASHI